MYGGPPQGHGGWPHPGAGGGYGSPYQGGYAGGRGGGGMGRPPPQYQQHHHAGIGSQGAAPNLPRPPNLGSSGPGPGQFSPGPPPANFVPGSGQFPGVAPSAGWNGDKFSLFVGNIADGVSDAWLERIVGTVGSVLNLRRPTPAFGFVEYGDPEAVLRCLEVVNGVSLKGKNGQEKALLIKADQKERARLDEYEKSRVKAEGPDEYMIQARDDLKQIVDRLNAGGELSSLDRNGSGPDGDDAKNKVPSHLNDLAPEELPENQRTTILSEIDLFRERTVKKAAERAAQDEARLKAQVSSHSSAGGGGSSSRGWGARAGSASSGTLSHSGGAVDPQSYNKPVGFVPSGAADGQSPAGQGQDRGALTAAPEVDDAGKERERAERAAREAEYLFRDRERRFEGRERARIASYEREQIRERQLEDQEQRDRAMMTERLATWDDEREAEKGREPFYVDRIRWRAQRRPFRLREQEADERDRQQEAAQLAAASKASEAFLAGLSGIGSGGELKAGEEGSAVKLSFAPTVAPKAKPAPATGRAPALMMSGDDEDDSKKKRALIPLTYSDDEDEDDVATTPAQRRRKIADKVPRDKTKLFTLPVQWDALNEDVIMRQIAPATTELIVEYLGAEEDELLNAVLSHIRNRKPASELVDELEPVLDEDAVAFVTKVWWQVVVEGRVAKREAKR